MGTATRFQPPSFVQGWAKKICRASETCTKQEGMDLDVMRRWWEERRTKMQGSGRVHKFHAPHRVRSTERRHDAGATPSFGCLLCSGLRQCVCYARQGRIPPSMHPCIHVPIRVQESTRTTIRRVSVLLPQRMPVVRRHACGVHVFVFFPLPCDAVEGRRIRWVGYTFMTPNFLFVESPSEIQGTSGPSLSNALPVQTIPEPHSHVTRPRGKEGKRGSRGSKLIPRGFLSAFVRIFRTWNRFVPIGAVEKRCSPSREFPLPTGPGPGGTREPRGEARESKRDPSGRDFEGGYLRRENVTR